MKKAIIVLLLLAPTSRGGEQEKARARVALAMSIKKDTCFCTGPSSCVCNPESCRCVACKAARQTDTCPCSGPQNCTCDLAGGRCGCKACIAAKRKRADEALRRARETMKRPVPAAAIYYPPPVFQPVPMMAPPVFFGGGGGRGGGC